MYLDETIIASLLVIAAALSVLGGFAYIVFQDVKKSHDNATEK